MLQQIDKAHDMAQGRPQIVGDRVAKGFQFLVGGRKLCRPLDDAVFQFRIETVDFILGVFPLCHIADIALNDGFATRAIDVADKFNGDVVPIPGFERQVIIADISMRLQSLQHGLVRLDIDERT